MRRIRLLGPLFLLFAAMMSPSCATTREPPAQSHGRVKDSPPEAVAAHRAAAPRSLELEADDQRWSIDAARERKRARENEQATRPSPAAPRKTADVVEPGVEPGVQPSGAR